MSNLKNSLITLGIAIFAQIAASLIIGAFPPDFSIIYIGEAVWFALLFPLHLQVWHCLTALALFGGILWVKGYRKPLATGTGKKSAYKKRQKQQSA